MSEKWEVLTYTDFDEAIHVVVSGTAKPITSGGIEADFVLEVFGEDVGFEEMERRARLAAAAPEMLAMLEELQWINNNKFTGHSCPYCGWLENEGHCPDCTFGNLLKKVRGK